MSNDDALGRTPGSDRLALPLSARPSPPLLSLLGIAVPFVVSLICAFIDLSILFLPWATFLLGVISAALLRSWWALLIVPIAIAIGTLPKIIFISHGLPDPTSPGFIAGAILFLLVGLFPSTIGAAIGVPLRHELERESGHLQIERDGGHRPPPTF
jgi:hypothetical protein